MVVELGLSNFCWRCRSIKLGPSHVEIHRTSNQSLQVFRTSLPTIISSTMFSKLVFAFLAAAAAVNAAVPSGVSNLDVTASTADSLTLSFTASLTATADEAGKVVAFTFGNADNTETFGSGSLTLPDTIPEDGAVSVAATATYSPTTESAKEAGSAVLGNYAANAGSLISVVSTDGTFTNIPLAAPGVETIQKLGLVVSLSALISGKGGVKITNNNSFSVPLTFVSLNSTATGPVGGSTITLGTITQNPLATPIVVAPKTAAVSGEIPATVKFTLTQALALITAIGGGKTIIANVNADAVILVGDYQTHVSLRNKAIPAGQA
ncbi:hypothetical protein BJ742DRAFT_353609 [Cladochytrium replicatum]|nr:hypothetical protein BJ742DRAFT_353609 [Cladochytrium replicatum]